MTVTDSIALRLDDFGPQPAPTKPPDSGPDPTASDTLQTYDEGYQAGWDDAQSAAEKTHAHVSAEFARTLQDLSFTFHEARFHAEAALEPLVQAMVECVLPDLLHTAFPQKLLDLLIPLAKDLEGQTITLRCAEHDLEALTQLTQVDYGLPLRLVPEPSLLPGQATFVLGHEHHAVDVASLRQAALDLLTEMLPHAVSPPTPEVLSNAG